MEKLSEPENLLRQDSYNEIWRNLIRKEANITRGEIEENEINFKYNIIAKSESSEHLVTYGYHSFFYGMYNAYADHRPFVLSPDMIWLLISQGFARHVNANPEKLRHFFVEFSGKTTLEVQANGNLLDMSENKWTEIFPQFTSQIAEHTGEELIDILTCNFSTTTPVEKVVSEITIMEAMEPYFEYIVMVIVCGIPEITLLGTTEDWQKILDKTKYLSKYDLEWWTKELVPILEEFVKASKGDIKKIFWRNMFKYHSKKKYGAPKIIDGWIVKFFPYDKDGNRNNLKEIVEIKNLPEEIVKVDLKYIEVDGEHTKETMLELWGGFIGLEQNHDNYALTPKIGWMIKKKDVNEQGIHQKLMADNIPQGFWGGISLIITKVPENLKKFEEIYSLTLYFKDNVFIPDWLKDIRIGKLTINGKITRTETDKIIKWFPNIDLRINGEAYNHGNNGWIKVSVSQISTVVLSLDKIWVLEILNYEQFIIPDELGNIEIENLSLVNEISYENIEKLKRLLPDTKIYMQGQRIQ